jgi:hypothetical protein
MNLGIKNFKKKKKKKITWINDFIEKKMLKKIDYKSLINNFASKRGRKIKI